jgi:hypothetical protein
VITDLTIRNNEPDIKIRANAKGTLPLIDIIMLGERNTMMTEAENILKYTNAATERECK